MSDRMSPVGSIMWGVGQDATLRMVVGNVIVLDRVPSRSALADRLGVAAEQVGRLRQRPDGSGGLRSRPVWEDVGEFDPANHVRAMAVASPGDLRQVLDLVGLLEPSPFDPAMSPWDVTVIEGLEGGRAALYLRAHHSLMDGAHGVSLVRSMLDDVRHRRRRRRTGSARRRGDEVVSGDVSVRRGWGRGVRPGTVNLTIDVAGAVYPIASGVASGVSAAMRIDPVDAVVRGVPAQLGCGEFGVASGGRDGRPVVAVVAVAVDEHPVRGVLGARGAGDGVGVGWEPQ